MEKYELPVPPNKRVPGNSSRGNAFDRTYLRPLFLKVRCPSCDKVYRIDSRDAEKSAPEFECLSCQVIFTFDAVEDPNNVVTRLIGAMNGRADVASGNVKVNSAASTSMPAGATSVDTAAVQDARKCPKCFALNPKSVPECLKCGVIFARVDGAEGGGAIPSLVKAWRDLMGDYTNLRKHFEFVDRCEDLRAIPYALKKYEDLKSVQPQDEIAQGMIRKVLMRQFARLAPEKTNFVQRLKDIPWARVGKMTPLVAGSILMLLGLIVPSLRNMVGIGVSLIFVTVGFIVFVKGRFAPRDFWEN